MKIDLWSAVCEAAARAGKATSLLEFSAYQLCDDNRLLAGVPESYRGVTPKEVALQD